MPPREHDDLCVFVTDRDPGTVGADQASAIKGIFNLIGLLQAPRTGFGSVTLEEFWSTPS